MFVLGTGWSFLALILSGIPPVATGRKTSCPSIDGCGKPVALALPFECDEGLPHFVLGECDECPCSAGLVRSVSALLVGMGSKVVDAGAVGRPVIVGSGVGCGVWKFSSDRNQSIKPSMPKYGLSVDGPRTSRSRLVG